MYSGSSIRHYSSYIKPTPLFRRRNIFYGVKLIFSLIIVVNFIFLLGFGLFAGLENIGIARPVTAVVLFLFNLIMLFLFGTFFYEAYLDDLRRLERPLSTPLAFNKDLGPRGLSHLLGPIRNQADEIPLPGSFAAARLTSKEESADSATRVKVEEAIWSDLQRQASEIVRMVERAKTQISKIDACLMKNMALTGGDEVDQVILARRIVHALEGRLVDINELISRKSETEINQVKDFLCSELEIPNDTMTAVLDAKKIAAIPPEHWEEALDELLIVEFDHEISAHS